LTSISTSGTPAATAADDLFGVDRHGDSRSLADKHAQALGIDDLVGQEEIVSQPRPSEHLRFGDGGACEAGVTHLLLACRENGAFVGLDVGPHPRARQRVGHRRQIGIKERPLDDQCRRGQLPDVHQPQRTELMEAAAAPVSTGLTTETQVGVVRPSWACYHGRRR
jgi:hypothetical protein